MPPPAESSPDCDVRAELTTQHCPQSGKVLPAGPGPTPAYVTQQPRADSHIPAPSTPLPLSPQLLFQPPPPYNEDTLYQLGERCNGRSSHVQLRTSTASYSSVEELSGALLSRRLRSTSTAPRRLAKYSEAAYLLAHWGTSKSSKPVDGNTGDHSQTENTAEETGRSNNAGTTSLSHNRHEPEPTTQEATDAGGKPTTSPTNPDTNERLAQPGSSALAVSTHPTDDVRHAEVAAEETRVVGSGLTVVETPSAPPVHQLEEGEREAAVDGEEGVPGDLRLPPPYEYMPREPPPPYPIFDQPSANVMYPGSVMEPPPPYYASPNRTVRTERRREERGPSTLDLYYDQRRSRRDGDIQLHGPLNPSPVTANYSARETQYNRNSRRQSVDDSGNCDERDMCICFLCFCYICLEFASVASQ